MNCRNAGHAAPVIYEQVGPFSLRMMPPESKTPLKLRKQRHQSAEGLWFGSQVKWLINTQGRQACAQPPFHLHTIRSISEDGRSRILSGEMKRTLKAEGVYFDEWTLASEARSKKFRRV
jgi:hypothetical protein